METKAEIDNLETRSSILYSVEDSENEDLKQIQDMLLAEEIEISDDEESDVEDKEMLDVGSVKESMFEESDFVVAAKLEEKQEKEENVPEFCCLCYNTFEDYDVEKHNAEEHAEDQEALKMVF